MGLASAAAILLAGWLIGATSIGGVLVVPALIGFDGMGLQPAIAVSAFAFAFPGAAALFRVGAPGDDARYLGALIAGAVSGAVPGALLVHHVDVRWLFAGLAMVALASGLRGLKPAPLDAPQRKPLGTGGAVILGVAVGLGSALTGTGGPVLLVPLLMLLRQPIARTVAAAQIIQLPIALCAGAAHWTSGALDVTSSCILGFVLLAGSIAGQRAARSMNVLVLQRLVCLLLLLVGGWFGWRSFQ